MNVQIPGWEWFPLLKGETPAERAQRATRSEWLAAPKARHNL